MPVSFIAFDQPGWQPDGGDHGPGLNIAENVLPVNSSFRLIQGKVAQASVADGPVTGALVHIFQQARVVQYARPSAVFSNTTWEPAINLPPLINEATPNDANFIYAPNAPTARVIVFNLNAITSPGGLTAGHIVQYRYAIPATTGAWSVEVELLQGLANTVIASDTVTGTGAQPGFLLRILALTTGQAAAITDYTKLLLRFTTTVAGSAATRATPARARWRPSWRAARRPRIGFCRRPWRPAPPWRATCAR